MQDGFFPFKFGTYLCEVILLIHVRITEQHAEPNPGLHCQTTIFRQKRKHSMSTINSHNLLFFFVAARLLRLWVRIPPGAWMSVCCECCVLSGRGLCDELITCPEESYWLWCVIVCDLETSRMGRPWPTFACSATGRKRRGEKKNFFFWDFMHHIIF